MAEYADKSPNHGKHMNSGQVLDINRSEACARPIHHQPVPNKYGKWWVMA